MFIKRHKVLIDPGYCNTSTAKYDYDILIPLRIADFHQWVLNYHYSNRERCLMLFYLSNLNIGVLRQKGPKRVSLRKFMPKTWPLLFSCSDCCMSALAVGAMQGISYSHSTQLCQQQPVPVEQPFRNSCCTNGANCLSQRVIWAVTTMKCAKQSIPSLIGRSAHDHWRRTAFGLMKKIPVRKIRSSPPAKYPQDLGNVAGLRYWQPPAAGRQVNVFLFNVSVSAVLNCHRSPWVLDSVKGVCCNQSGLYELDKVSLLGAAGINCLLFADDWITLVSSAGLK